MSAECKDCGIDYASSSWADVVIPDVVWEHITAHDGAALLCFNCMNRRLVAMRYEHNVPFQVTSGPFHFAPRHDTTAVI